MIQLFKCESSCENEITAYQYNRDNVNMLIGLMKLNNRKFQLILFRQRV